MSNSGSKEQRFKGQGSRGKKQAADRGRRTVDVKSSRPSTVDRRMTPNQNGAAGRTGGYKFERLDVWKLSLEYLDLVYQIADRLPKREEHNLKSQIVRAATSVALNIACPVK